MSDELDFNTLTPSEYLMVEALIARLRLGETCWTFPAGRYVPIARRVEDKGFASWKHGVIQDTIIVFPSKALKKYLAARPYIAPITVKEDYPDKFVLGSDKQGEYVLDIAP